MDDKAKQIFHKMVRELEDLRAKVGLLTAYALSEASPADQQDGLNQAKELNHEHYEALRKEIDAL